MLVRYEAALAAMAAARTADEVKDISNKAAAMAAYARMAKDPQLEIDATEIRARATRRIGEMMAEQRETIGLNEGGRPKTGVSEPQFRSPRSPKRASTKILPSRRAVWRRFLTRVRAFVSSMADACFCRE